jgi:hypothetical protein
MNNEQETFLVNVSIALDRTITWTSLFEDGKNKPEIQNMKKDKADCEISRGSVVWEYFYLGTQQSKFVGNRFNIWNAIILKK